MTEQPPIAEFFEKHPLFPHYTPEQLNLIGEAVRDASICVDNAYQTLRLMFDYYFLTEYGQSSLACDAEDELEAIAARLNTAIEQIAEARRDLNVFADVNNTALYPLIRDIKVKRRYLDHYKNEIEGEDWELGECMRAMALEHLQKKPRTDAAVQSTSIQSSTTET